ncbi:hypothetical protein E4U28_002962 [Claviceps purpurea]|nr:hypothetical protein E4U28_002962 [Claviceps purpurea]
MLPNGWGFCKVSVGEIGYLVEEIMDGSRSRTGKIEPRLHELMAFTSRSRAICRQQKRAPFLVAVYRLGIHSDHSQFVMKMIDLQPIIG